MPHYRFAARAENRHRDQCVCAVQRSISCADFSDRAELFVRFIVFKCCYFNAVHCAVGRDDADRIVDIEPIWQGKIGFRAGAAALPQGKNFLCDRAVISGSDGEDLGQGGSGRIADGRCDLAFEQCRS